MYLQAAKLEEDSAFPENEHGAIELKVTPTPCEPESIVLSVSGEETNNLKLNDKQDPQGHNIFPVSPESYSSSEEELKDIQRASESLLKETVADLAIIKETVHGKYYSDSREEEFIQIKQTSADLSPIQNPKQISEKDHKLLPDISDADTENTDHEDEKAIGKRNVLEESADTFLFSQEQEDQLKQVSSFDKTVKTFSLNDNEKKETTDLKSTMAVSIQQNAPVSQISEEESFAEDLSKDGGSSSMQVSHITSGTTSPTSLSSLGEESDSSPFHKKENLEAKQQRKFKHRQGQQTVADSSEEEENLQDGDQLLQQEIQREIDQRQYTKPYKMPSIEKDKSLEHPPNTYSQTESIYQTDEVLQFSEIKTYETFSYSNISPSTESEQENVVGHQLPQVEVMHDVGEKQLKSADEVYEEMMQKAQELKAMTKKITPPEIEPLFGGMLIEDYVYESLVEEPAQAMAADYNTTVDKYQSSVSFPETVRKLRTPDEAYKEMQKNREFMVKDQTTEHAQVNKPVHHTDTTVTIGTDTCYVDISESYEFTKHQDENWEWYAETANDELLNREKEVMTPGTSPTQSTPLSPVSPLSSSEPLYDSAEVIQIPSSGEEDNDRDEFATEPIECAMEPYKDESAPPECQPVKNILFPIPDLKITQCSSGEEEPEDEESITQEHEIVKLNGIAQYDDRSEEDFEFIESSAEAKSIEFGPTSVVSEVPLSTPAHEHVLPASGWDLQASPLSPPISSSDLTGYSSCLIDQTAGQGSIQPKTYVAESSTMFGSDSTHVVISIADLVSKQAPQDFVQTTPLSEEIVCPSQVVSPSQLTKSISTAPSLPGMSPLVSCRDIDVSESSVTPEPIQTPMPADLSISEPSPAPKPFTLKSTCDSIIVTIQDEVSQPDSVLQPPHSASSESATAPQYVSQVPIPCEASNSSVPHPIQVTSLGPSLDISRFNRREHTSPIIVPEPVPIIIEMPEMPRDSPPKYQIHSTAVTTVAHTPPLISTSTNDREHISSPTAVSTCSSTDTLTTVQSISVARYDPSLSLEQSSICSTILEATKSSASVNSVMQHPHVSPSIHAADTTYITSAIKIPISSCIDDAKSLVQATAVHEVPVAISETCQSVDHASRNTAVALITSSSLPTQSIVEDTKPKTGDFQSDGAQIVTRFLQTRQDDAVILPNVENIPIIKQESNNIITTAMTTPVQQVGSLPLIVNESPVIILGASSLPTDLAFVSSQLESEVASVSRERADKPVIEFPPPPAASPPALPSDSLTNASFSRQSVVPTSTESDRNISNQVPIASIKQAETTIHKSPPPVPPKPLLPGGLVFSHKSKESAKPSGISETAFAHVGHAATLPRTREPPKALTLSLTAPTDIKLSISSPKSPLSPRFAKTLETYVVITLPSEPGSPVEGVTTQAPIRRPSLPTLKQQEFGIVSTMFTPSVSAQLPMISQPVIIPPKVISAPVMTAAVIPGETGDFATDVTNKKAIHSSTAKILTTDVTVTSASSAVSVPQSEATSPVFVSKTETSVLPIRFHEEKNIYCASPLTPTMYPAPTVISIPTVTSPVLTEIPDMAIKPKIHTVSTGVSASASSIVSVPHSTATSIALVPQIDKVMQSIKKETDEEKNINFAPVTTKLYPGPTVVSIPTVTSPVLTEIPDIMIAPNINTVYTAPESSVFSVSHSTAPSLAFLPQIETDTEVPIKRRREIYEEKSIYSVLPVNTTEYPAATVVSVTSADPLLVGSFVAEIPGMTTEPKTNISIVTSATELCASHGPQTECASVVPGSVLIQGIPVELTPTAITSTFSREPFDSCDVMEGTERQLIQTVHPTQITTAALSSTDKMSVQMLEMEEEIRYRKAPSSDQIQQHQICFESQQIVPSVPATTYISTVPVTLAQIKNSVESQDISGPDKVLSSMSQLCSTIATKEQHQYALPNLLAQVVTTEVQRTTTVSVVQERIPLEPTYRQASARQNGKTHCIDDVIDLATLNVSVAMTEKGMDLTTPESHLQSSLSDLSSRQITAVQPKIVNLSAEITPATTLALVTNSITVVTCTATFTYNNNIMVDSPHNLQSVTSMPLPLKTYKPFEPLSQIVYRPVNSQPTTNTEIPINLSCGPTESTAPLSLPVRMSPTIYTPSSVPIHVEPSVTGAIDLTISKPKRTILALTTSTGVVTSVVEEDAAPVDLTAGRRTVCCDILYRLPFTGSCRTQPPVTTTDKQFGLRSYDQYNAKTLGIGSNLTQSDLVTKNGVVSQHDAPDGAIDLTAKMSRGQYHSAQ